MKFENFFVEFYFEFILLINQLKNYLKRIKINRLKKRITISFQRVIVSLKKVISLRTFKNKFLSINIRLNNIRASQIFKNKDKNKSHVVKLYKTLSNFNRFTFKIAREFFFVKKQILRNIVEKIL